MPDFSPAEIKPTIAFTALDIRVGTIDRVEDVAKSEKLLKLAVTFGDHSRSILAGMKKERADPREIEGKQALFAVNLEPRKIESLSFRTEQADAFVFPIHSDESVGLRGEKSLFDLSNFRGVKVNLRPHPAATLTISANNPYAVAAEQFSQNKTTVISNGASRRFCLSDSF